MRNILGEGLKRIFCSAFVAALVAGTILSAQAATVSPKLRDRLSSLADSASVGMVVVSFNTSNGFQELHLKVLRGVGITGGTTYPTLGMIAQPMTAGQVRALSGRQADLAARLMTYRQLFTTGG